MPASNEIQVAGGEPGPPNLDEIETGVGASSAKDADDDEANDESSDTDDDSDETNDESSAVVVGTTTCVLATLFSL